MTKTTKEQWISTYGLITIQRILDRCHIKLSTKFIIKSLKLENSVLTKVLNVPSTNIYNGILLQQVQDYKNFVQKMFIDYLLLGQNEMNSQNITLHDQLEEKRNELLEKISQLDAIEQQAIQLIVKSQQFIINHIKTFNLEIKQQTRALLGRLSNLNDDNKLFELLIFLYINFDKTSLPLNHDWQYLSECLSSELSEQDRALLLEPLPHFAMLTETILTGLEHFFNESKDLMHLIQSQVDLFYNYLIEIKDLIQMLPNHQFFTIKYQEHLNDIIFNKNLI